MNLQWHLSRKILFYKLSLILVFVLVAFFLCKTDNVLATTSRLVLSDYVGDDVTRLSGKYSRKFRSCRAFFLKVFTQGGIATIFISAAKN